jgi:type II secretory pathway pseudopilin PulG
MKKKGESIIEVLVAIIILTIVMTAAFKALTNTTTANIDVKNRIIALNIAREGIEAVRNIRDTNWLKYSGNTKEKWLCHDTEDDPDNCIGGTLNKLVNGFYTANFSSTHDRYLLSLIATNTSHRLDLESPSLNIEDFHLFKETNKKFTYDDDGGANSISPFYHQIEIEIPAPANICNNITYNNCAEDKIKIISRVQWKEGDKFKKTVLEAHLFNFYNRTSY